MRGRNARPSGPTAFAAAACLVALAALGPAGCRRAAPGAAGTPASRSDAAATTTLLPFELYFPAPGGRLRAERRELAVSSEPAERARALVTALLAGPTSEGLSAPLPAGVEVGSLDLSPAPESVLFLEFESATYASPPPSGSEQELQTVYSVVDTVLLNVPEIRRVVLLWNGSQRESFAGHVDTASALGAREALIDRS